MANKQSYLHTPAVIPYEYVSLPDKLDIRAGQFPLKEAYVFISKPKDSETLARNHLPFRDIAERSKQVAAGLLSLGLRPGDRVAILGPPSAEWLYVEYAALRIKVLLVRIPGTLAQSESFNGFLKKHECRMLMLDAGINPSVLAALQMNIPNFDEKAARHQLGETLAYPAMILSTVKSTNLQTFVTISDLLLRFVDGHFTEVMDIQSQIDMDDPAVVFPTTGTTGKPKLVVSSHFRQYFAHSMLLLSHTEIESTRHDLRFFNNRPYTWSGSFVLTPAALGWTMICMDEELSAGENSLQYLLQTLSSERVDLAFLPVFLMYNILNTQQSIPACLQYIVTAGEKVPNSVLASLLKHVRAVYIMYGCSEALGAISSGGIHGADNLDIEASAHYKPLADCHIKVTCDDGRILPRGQPGTIWLKEVSSGYYLDDQSATDAIKSKSGWVNTKDAGIIHPSGFLQVIGRTSDLISKGGCNVYPITIENMLMTCESVSKAVVVGIADDVYGHEIAACVVPKEGQELSREDLRIFCTQSGTVTAGIPLYPKLFTVCDALPMLANGKTDMQKVRQILNEETRTRMH